MEWYWVVTLIVGFFGIAGVLVWLGKSGKLSVNDMGTISTIATALSAVSTSLANATENATIDAFAMIMQLLDRAAKAAENAYYNNLITADERRAACMKNFDELLKAAGITLTEAQRGIIDTLIGAACEDIGHSILLGEVDENGSFEQKPTASVVVE